MLAHPNPSVPFPSGDVAALTDQIAWCVTSDLQVACLVNTDSSGAVQKRLMTMAEVVCHITQTQGATEAAMLDHDMTPMTKARLLTKFCPVQIIVNHVGPSAEVTKRGAMAIPCARWLAMTLGYCNFAIPSVAVQRPTLSNPSRWRTTCWMCATRNWVDASLTTTSYSRLQMLDLFGRQGYQS